MNYIGSKLSLMDFLTQTIEEVTGISDGEGHILADLFAGTGIVGSTYREQGWKVISNDIQTYSYVLNKHYIENPHSMTDGLTDYLNELDGIDGFVYNNYCLGSGSERCYFTDENGRKCDAIRTEIDELLKTNRINENQYYWYLASLINSIDKYANTASVYGAFLKHVKKSASQEFELNLLPKNHGIHKGKVYNEDINSLVRKNEVCGDVLYLDPPYNQRQYCTNYHVLETIARYDNPKLNGKTGLREYKAQKSLYCSARTVADTFDDLIKNADFKYIFLSYNNEGLMPLDTIKEIMSRYGKYELFKKEDYHRFRADKENNRNHKCSTTTEYLHCLIKFGV